jgi:hypothetical protein
VLLVEHPYGDHISFGIRHPKWDLGFPEVS